jgi:hypothetical protein
LPGNPNYDAIQTTTIEKYVDKTLRDQIFDSSALLRLIKDRQNITLDGGQVLTEPVMFAKNNTAGSYRGHDVHPNTPQGGISQAQYDWKQTVASVVISGLEDEVQNVGDSAVIKLLSSRMAQAEESLIDVMNIAMFSDGTGNGGKDIVGLALAVDAAGTYGNINRTTETYWSSVELAAGGALAVEGTSVSLQRLHARCSKGGGKQSPDLYMTTSIIYQAYEQFFTPDRRFADSKLADYGFESLKFKTADMTWDEVCTSQVVYALNTKTWKFVSHPSRNFAVVGPFYPTDADSKVWKIYWAGAFLCNEPRRNGKLTGVTNS